MNPIVSNGNKLKWKIENVKELTFVGMVSDNFTFKNIDWYMKVRTETINSVKCLSLYLYFDEDNKREGNWICETKSIFKVLNQNGNGKDMTEEDVVIYDANKYSWGFDLLEWPKLESDGYMKDNSVIVEIEFDFKYYDFSKNIPNYTDIILNVENTQFYVNKGLLCSKSEYFYNKFVVEMSEEKELMIENVKVEDFRLFIASFCLLFEAIIDDNYEQLMKLAVEYKTPQLHRSCEKFLISYKTLKIEQKIEYAEKYNYNELMKTCINSITTAAEIKQIRSSIEFENLKDTTKLAIMTHLLDFV